jgi:hypothetical protein
VVEEYFYAYNALLDRSRRGAYAYTEPGRITLPLLAILSRVGGRQWWADRRAILPPEFVAEIEGLFPDVTCADV